MSKNGYINLGKLWDDVEDGEGGYVDTVTLSDDQKRAIVSAYMLREEKPCIAYVGGLWGPNGTALPMNQYVFLTAAKLAASTYAVSGRLYDEDSGEWVTFGRTVEM